MDGSSKIEEVPLDGNRASVTTSYKWSDPVRNHAIAALYSGNLYDAGSTSHADSVRWEFPSTDEGYCDILVD